MRNRWQQLTAILTNAVSAITVQVLAIVFLTPWEYGRFSLGYVLYAAGVSAVYAIVCDAWSRSKNHHLSNSWGHYAAALVMLVAAITVPIGALLAMLQFGPAGAWIAIAIFTNLCRMGVRYHAVAHDEHRYIAPADVLGLIGTIATFFILLGGTGPFQAVAVAWAIGGIIALLASKRLVLKRRALRDWIRTNAHSIKALGADAVLVDATAIGVPLLISPLLGITNFGIYRSLSSTAIPVRLALNPLRPTVMSRPSNYFFVRGRFLYVLAGSLVFGSGVWLALSIVASRNLFSGGILSALSVFALPAGVYVASNFISTLFYISNRSHLAAKVLITIGCAQLVFAVALPIGGFLLGGLPVLVSAFALTGVLNAGVNAMVAFRFASP